MLLVAFVVLALSFVATYGLVRRSLQESALSSLRDRAEALGDIAQDDSIARLPRQRLRLALRVTDISAVGVRPNGDIAPAAGDNALPAPLTPADVKPQRLLAGEQVSGRRGDTVFLAVPTDSYVRRARVVVVATDTVDTSVLREAFPLLLLAGLAVLGLAAAVAVWIARRLTQPIGAIEDAARRLAGGDLSARAEVPPSTDDELAGLAATLNDLAARLDRARGAERAFLLSISHDLRTPLTSIRGYAEALGDGLLDDADPAERRRAAHVIGAEARRLERLVRDLLDLSRLDTRQFSLHPEPCDAAAVVRDAAAAFVPQAQELGLTIVTDAGPVARADVDPERLGQIVANLVENALKYAAARVDVHASASQTGDVMLVVTDDGPGVPVDQLDAVFDRLYTVRDAPGRAVGTGLGLAIVHELATAMGGRAYAEAPAGGGSRFVVVIPANVAAAH
jgi:two-component system sensor histidine kinase BaeS